MHVCSDGEVIPGVGVWRKKNIVREDDIARVCMVGIGHIEGPRKGGGRAVGVGVGGCGVLGVKCGRRVASSGCLWIDSTICIITVNI